MSLCLYVSHTQTHDQGGVQRDPGVVSRDPGVVSRWSRGVGVELDFVDPGPSHPARASEFLDPTSAAIADLRLSSD